VPGRARPSRNLQARLRRDIQLAAFNLLMMDKSPWIGGLMVKRAGLGAWAGACSGVQIFAGLAG